MRKKILIAEKSDAIRSIAESILHQNGYDVISASSAEKAKELIITAEPNMLIIGADFKDSEGKYFYDIIENGPNTASMPLLIISDPNNTSLPYPPEVVLPRPFEPQDFIERVKLFVGGGESSDEAKIEEKEPFASDSVDDDFLDAALGIDRIEVEESEVLDKTHISQRIRQIAAEKKRDVYDLHQESGSVKSETDDSSKRVESLMIRDDTPEEAARKKKEAEDLQRQSKLEIQSDQYGLVSQKDQKGSEPSPESKPPAGDHDYDWFIKEMQKESTDKSKSQAKTEPSNDKLETKQTSDAIEPILPPAPNSTEDSLQDASGNIEEPQINPGGVDQFITEFKKEIEQLSQSPSEKAVPEETVKETAAVNTAIEEKPIRQEDPTPILDPAEIHHFVSHLVEMLAEKIAKRIVDKIDKDEVYRMLRDELAEMIAQKNDLDQF